MNSALTIERKRIDCNALPKGWQREENLRKSGIAAGKVDVYYYSPTGKRIDSKPQLARYLGDAIDISSFDFQTGKMIEHHLPPPPAAPAPAMQRGGNGNEPLGMPSAGNPPPNQPPNDSTMSNSPNNGTALLALPSSSNALKRKLKTNGNTSYSHSYATQGASGGNGTSNNNSNPTSTAPNVRQQLDYSRAMRPDVSLVPPIRQTASIFKQPVTVVRNHENTKVKNDPKQGSAAAATTPQNQEKPKQLFWEKRMERMRACHAATGEEFADIGLPKAIIKPIGPNVNEHTVLQSLATALHVLNGVPVTGQAGKTEMLKNATAFINPEQPLMQHALISDEDVRRQEERVTNARKKLQEALKA